MVEENTAPSRARRQAFSGVVVSDRQDKTVVVAVERTVMDQLYRRYLKRTARFQAHDEENECQLGDRVEIVSTRPLSRNKRWRVRTILERARGS